MIKVYLVMEHPDFIGGTTEDAGRVIHAAFFARERAEDFVRGIISYVHSYEPRRLLLRDGKAKDEDHATQFEIVEVHIL